MVGTKNSNYLIYDHISPSGKHYVGQTCTNNRWGYEGHNYLRKKNGKYINSAFAPAINKYGWDNFEHKILFTGLTKLDADMIERDLIFYYKKLGKSYNITEGGEGVMQGRKHTEASKKKMIDSANKRAKKVNQYSLDGTFIREWISISEAGKTTGINIQNISKCCHNQKNSAGGFIWRF